MANEINIKGTWKAIDVDLSHEYTFNSTSNTWEVSNGGELTSGKFIYFMHNLDTYNIAYLGDFTFENGALSSGNNYNHVSGIYRITEDVKAVGIAQSGQLRVISDGNNDGTIFGIADSTIYGEVVSSDFVAPDVTDISSLSTDIYAGPIVKPVAASDTYDSSKKYVYKDLSGKYQAISGPDHFTCIKDGYWDIADNTNTDDSDDVTEYFTVADNGDLIHCEVPAINNRTWADRLAFSAQIKDVDIYTVRQMNNSIANKTKVYLSDGAVRTYYDKVNNDYIKHSITTYDRLDEVEGLWEEEYTCNIKIVKVDGKSRVIYTWQREGVEEAEVIESGYYLYYLEFNNLHEVGLFNLIFDGQNVCTNISGLSDVATLYRLPDSFQSSPKSLYIKLNDILQEFNIIDSYDKIIPLSEFDITAKAYTKQGIWTYPDIMDFSNESLELSDSYNNYIAYSTELFPPYDQGINQNPLVKTKSTQYSIFEKTAVSIDYRYQGNANSLIPVFVSESAPLNNLST